MIIEQFLPAFHYGDAIGNSTITLHKHLKKNGYDSRIIALSIDSILEKEAILFKNYKENTNSIKILHFAIPSELTDYFIRAKGKKVIIYHNITPSGFFVDFSDDLVKFTSTGRQHLEKLKDVFDLAIADSEYNCAELKVLNYKNVFSFPIMVDLEDYNKPYSRPFYQLLKDNRKNIIFIGRITPNKKIEDLIKITFFYKKYLDSSIRLIIGGNTKTLPRYFRSLKDLAARFYLTSDDVIFTGHIPFEELLSIYKLGDVFISMSEHEGFCLPLIESCLFEVPVIAYNAGAVSETLKGAGIVVNEKNHAYIAAMAEKIMKNKELKEKLQLNEKKRIADYRRDSDPAKILELILKY